MFSTFEDYVFLLVNQLHTSRIVQFCILSKSLNACTYFRRLQFEIKLSKFFNGLIFIFLSIVHFPKKICHSLKQWLSLIFQLMTFCKTANGAFFVRPYKRKKKSLSRFVKQIAKQSLSAKMAIFQLKGFPAAI